MSLARRTVRHVVIYSAGLSLSRGVGFLLIPLYARVWRQDLSELAIWDISTATILFLVPVLEIGVATAAVRFYYHYDDESLRARLFGNSLIVLALTSVLALACAALFAGALSEIIFGSPHRADLIFLIGAVGAATAWSNLPLAVLRAQERSKTFATLNVVRAAVGPVVIIALVVGYDMGTAGVLLGELAGLGVMTVAGLWICRRAIKPSFDRSLLAEMLAFGAPLMPIGIAAAIVTLSDRYILQEIFGLEAMAPYSLGFKVALVMTMLTRALQTAWPPAAYQLANDPAGPLTIARVHRFGLAFFLGLALGLTAFAPEIIWVFGTPELASAAVYLPWFAFSYAVSVGVLFLSTNITITKRTAYAGIIFGAGAVCKITLTFLLVDAAGMIGAAAATLLTFAIELVLALFLAQRVYPIHYQYAKFVALFLIAAGLAIGMMAATTLTYATGLLTRALLLGLYPLLLLISGVILLSEWQSIKTILLNRLCVKAPAKPLEDGYEA